MINILEKSIQKSIIHYLRLRNFITIDCDSMFALSYIPSISKKRFAFINEKKLKGWTKGQPDLIIISPEGKIFFVEMKNDKGRQSEEQKYFQEIITERGLNYFVWRNLDDCINTLKKFS